MSEPAGALSSNFVRSEETRIKLDVLSPASSKYNPAAPADAAAPPELRTNDLSSTWVFVEVMLLTVPAIFTISPTPPRLIVVTPAPELPILTACTLDPEPILTV